MLKSIWFFSVAVMLSFGAFAQQDTISIEEQKIVTYKPDSTKEDRPSLFRDSAKLQSPRKAILRSAIIPGWGQARNGKWWKVPLVYGGFVGIGLYYEFNQRFYKDLLQESQYRKTRTDEQETWEDPKYKGVTNDQQIFNAKDFYRRNRDLAIMAFVAFYGINLLDAYIDARLATFDVSDDLSLKVSPDLSIPYYAGFSQAPTPMLKLTLKF